MTDLKVANQNRSILAVTICLRIIVLLQCVGVAGLYWFSASEIESDVYGLLKFDFRWPESIAQRIDDVGALTCLAAGLILIFPFHRFRFVHSVAAAVVAVWMLAVAVTHMVRGGKYVEWALAEHAVRYAAPLVLSVFSWPVVDVATKRFRIGMWVLIVATAATFAAHGMKAIFHYGPFADLLLLTSMNWDLDHVMGFEFNESVVHRLLWIIGGVDLLVAALLVSTRMRIFAVYLVFWGAVTAFSRVTALGFEAWPETLIRSANWGCPVALVVYFASGSQNQSK